MNRIKSFYRMTLLASSIMIIIGCGGEGGSGDTTQPPMPEGNDKVVAMDGFSVVKPNAATDVDLSPFIRGTNAKITKVTLQAGDEHCGKSTPNGVTIEIETSGSSYCEYEYTVASVGEGSAKAQLNVLATTAEQPLLPPISDAFVLGGSDVNFDLQALLKEDWKSTYQLDASSVSVQGTGGNLGVASAASDRVISYKLPSLSGWNRIVYTLKDTANPGNDVMGVIYATVSESINQPPRIGQLEYDFNASNPSVEVVTSQSISLDLATLPNLNIVEPDGQEWQIVHVQSFTASVAVEEPISTTNKTITFVAPTIGEHVISYIVADHYGGYSPGLIKVNVTAKEITPTWKSLVAAGNTYSAPQTYSQATQNGFNVFALWDSGVSNTVAGYQQQVANSYCSTIGLLPTVNDMNALRNSYLVADTVTGELAKWPVQQRYLVKDESGMTTYDLVSGNTQANYNTKPSYVTCLENRNMVMKMTNYTVVANGQQVSVAEVTMPQPDDTFTINRVEGTLSELDTNLRLGDQVGSTTPVTTFSTKAGTYRFSVTDDSDRFSVLTSSTISYIGDRETGLFAADTGLVVTSNSAAPNGVSENIVTATLTDVNGNVVGGEVISVSLTEKGVNDDSVEYTLSPVSGKTDRDGQLKIKLTNTEMEPVDVEVSYTRPDGVIEKSETVQVNFGVETYPCGGVAGDYNCLPVQEQKDKRGWLFTPTMSKEFATNNNVLSKLTLGYTELTHPTSNLTAISVSPAELRRETKCQVLSDMRFSGRTNWRTARVHEMRSFVDSNFPKLEETTSWPGFYRFWGGTVYHDHYVEPRFSYGLAGTSYDTLQAFAVGEEDFFWWEQHGTTGPGADASHSYMCVSEP
ncbi:Ig-like domain-containing protein [Vibrio sp. B172a]|uniref:Ig-like domain-containing protein n=1 Tax=Vibrio sp. B172a TaxID=2835790 RepID=UPI0025534D7C|nr:Ig-like domain-containing protein [Vibrio sp. B172a]MDK9782322.1 Ig-like domain-containing protein [Vibrio sp. B172a]